MQSLQNMEPHPLDLELSDEFKNCPKILLIGFFNSGKSSFIKLMAKEELDIPIGDGTVGCTNELKF